jgi:hypothetical protein
MPRLYVVHDGDKEKHKNLLAFKIGENDFLPIEIKNEMVIPYPEKRGPLPEATLLIYWMEEEHAERLLKGIPVPVYHIIDFLTEE